MKLSQEQAAELFTIRIRGAMAAAFEHANIIPTYEQWAMLTGTREITMRDLGEISFITRVHFSLSFQDTTEPSPLEQPHD